MQADSFNRSRIATTVAVALTSNLRLVEAPGNVLVPRRASGLPKDSVANVSQVVTVDRDVLTARAGKVDRELLGAFADGLRLVLDLWAALRAHRYRASGGGWRTRCDDRGDPLVTASGGRGACYGWPATFTGAGLDAAEPSPSWPLAFSPQQ
jgi:mRNA interferase MazF